jgi:YD repeat-containing protein
VGAGAEARTTYFAFDSLNRLASVTAPDGGVTAFRYDRNGNRVSEENPLGNLTYYDYDERDLLVRVQDALGETAYYEYNEVGSLTKSTSPDGRVGNFEYDQAERRTRAYYGDGYAAYFGFDAAGNMLAAQEAAEGTVYFAYDRMNRVTSQKFAAGAGGGSAYYSYDENSNRTKLIYPSGGTAYYVFDELDRMASVKAPSGKITSYEFDASGNRTKSVWGNGSYSYYAFDAALRLSNIRHFKADGTALAYFDHDRDAGGDITHIARLDGLTTYYGYDANKRLTGENWKTAAGSSIYAFEYGYDLAGNRVRAALLGEATYWSYNAAGALTERVDSSGTAVYTYDPDGNLVVIEEAGGAVTYFEHGAHGLVTKITPMGGTAISFGYDALLRRVRMTEGAVSTYFRHDGLNLLEVCTSAGSVTKLTHGYQVINGIGSVVEVDVDGTRYFLHQDQRGTCYKITDADGDVVWTGLCDAWGVALAEVGTNPTIFWYQGQAWWKLTVNSRLYYVSPTRIYDSRGGGFIEQDPLPYLVKGQATSEGNVFKHWLRIPPWSEAISNYMNLYLASGICIASRYTYLEGRIPPHGDPTGLGLTGVEWHHIVGDWYAHYSAYGPRAQGLKILLEAQFHRGAGGLESSLTAIRNLMRSNELTQFAAYNRILLVHLRNLPSIITSRRAAVASAGGGTTAGVTFSGGGQAALGTLGYTTAGQAALAATGIAVVAAGAIVTYYLANEYMHYWGIAKELESDMEAHNASARAGQVIGGQYADKVTTALMPRMTCPQARTREKDTCISEFGYLVRNRFSSLLTLAGSGRLLMSLQEAQLNALENAVAKLIRCLEDKACCKPKDTVEPSP